MAVSAKNEYYKIWQSFLEGKYNLCISNGIIEEYLEVISKNIHPKFAEMIVYAILSSQNVIRVDPTFAFMFITADLDDNKFVDCAIASNAHYIVTEDKHFNVLKHISFPKVSVIGIDDFLKQLSE